MHDIADGITDGRVLPVEIGLLSAKEVEIVFSRRFVPFPGTAFVDRSE